GRVAIFKAARVVLRLSRRRPGQPRGRRGHLGVMSPRASERGLEGWAATLGMARRARSFLPLGYSRCEHEQDRAAATSGDPTPLRTAQKVMSPRASARGLGDGRQVYARDDKTGQIL